MCIRDRPIGKKAYEHFTKANFKVVNEFWELFSGLSFDKVQAAAQYAMNAFSNKEIDAVELVYSEFKNAGTQRFVAEQFLPVQRITGNQTSKKADFIFEPGKETLVTELMPDVYKRQVRASSINSLSTSSTMAK